MMETKIRYKIPPGFMNIAVTKYTLIADTNDSVNWKEMSIHLPIGKWEIHSYDTEKRIVTLIKK